LRLSPVLYSGNVDFRVWKKIRVGWATPFDVVEVLDHLVLNRGEPKSRHPGSSQRQPILLVGWGPPCFPEQL
jgi:hypothetical protein